jgi:predicted nucleic acid-binding Zn ribbon protein
LKSKFQNIGVSLNRILEQYHLNNAYKESELIRNWSKIVNKSLSGVSRPESLKDGLLVLRVSSNSWKEEINKNKDNLILMINKAFNENLVKQINLI